MIKFLVIAIGFVGFGLSAQVPAQSEIVIYDNGAILDNFLHSDLDSAFCASDPNDFIFCTKFADDFILGSDQNTITAVRWTGTYADAQTPTVNNFTIQIFRDAPEGGPGEMLHSYSAGTAGVNDTGDDLYIDFVSTFFNIYEYVAVIDPLTLAPGTYWISIINDTTGDSDDAWFWSVDALSGNAYVHGGDFNWVLEGFFQPAMDFQIINSVTETIQSGLSIILIKAAIDAKNP